MVYLAVTRIAFARDGLAPHRGEQGIEPLRRPWDRRPFDDPEVVEAFVAHCDLVAVQAYVERLLAEADRLSAVFVNWFLTRDYDDLWETHLRGLPNAPLLRLWKDSGLHAGNGRARPALAAWLRVRERPRR